MKQLTDLTESEIKALSKRISSMMTDEFDIAQDDVAWFWGALMEGLRTISPKPKTQPSIVYEIVLDQTASPPIEVAQGKFMSGVFKLSEESNIIGHGLNIVRTRG